MKEATLWAFGAVLAFLITAGAFLLLANLATGSSEESLAPNPGDGPARPGSSLDLDLNKGRLEALRSAPDQSLEIDVENTGERTYSDVNLTLRVSSDDTAYPQTRYYRHTVKDLTAGEIAPVVFTLDLSDTLPTTQSVSATPSESQKILEIRATTPEGVSAVRTAIVPM